MYEIDFLPVESDSGTGSKSGDAICVRFEHQGRQVVVVVDAGFSKVGDETADHIEKYYNTSTVDLIISTHPDADHLNGIRTLMGRLQVGELLIHDPRIHFADLSGFSNLDAVVETIDMANTLQVSVSEPFLGLERFEGKVRVLGPSRSYYVDKIRESLDDDGAGAFATTVTEVKKLGRSLLSRALSYFPLETLTDESDVSGRNNSSVITLFTLAGQRVLLTGDAGVEALDLAADEYEQLAGSFFRTPLTFLQAPHHGSQRNLGPTLLNRILGTSGAPFAQTTAFISSAKISEKHPSPKVVNALSRRGCLVSATEGRTICHHHDGPGRPGWTTLTPLGPLDEEDS